MNDGAMVQIGGGGSTSLAGDVLVAAGKSSSGAGGSLSLHAGETEEIVAPLSAQLSAIDAANGVLPALPSILKAWTKEIIRANPEDVNTWSAE